MGKQSARLWFNGHDHKDIYYQGHYHDKMYIGSQLVWERLGDALWEVFKVNNTSNVVVYDAAFYDGLFMALVYHVEEDKSYLYTSEDGVNFETLYLEINDLSVYKVYRKNDVTYLLNSGNTQYSISQGIISTLSSINYRMFGYNVGFTASTTDIERQFISNAGKVYRLRSCIDQYAKFVADGIKMVIKAGYYLYESTDMVNWDCINCKIYDTEQVATESICHYVYCPVGLKNGDLITLNGNHYFCGEIGTLNATTDGIFYITYEDKFVKTSEFECYSIFCEMKTSSAVTNRNGIYQVYGRLASGAWDSLYTVDFEHFYENQLDIFDYSIINQLEIFGEDTSVFPYTSAEGNNGHVFFFSGSDILIVETDKDFKIIKAESFRFETSDLPSKQKELLFGNGIYVYVYYSYDQYDSARNGVRALIKKEE